MSKYLYVVALLLGLAPFFSHADCNRKEDSEAKTIIPLPQQLLVSSKSYAPNEILYDSGYISGGTVTIQDCRDTYYVGFHYGGALTNASPLQDNIYPITNSNGSTVTGIGIRVYTMNQAGPYDDPRPIDNTWQSHDAGNRSDHTLGSSAYRVQLIATGGPITSGTFNVPNPLARVDYRETESINGSDGDVASSLSLSNTTIQVSAMGCSANTANLTFAMGSVEVSAFDTSDYVYSGEPQTVSLACEPGTQVALTLSGTTVPDDTSTIALSDDGSGTVATGIGVQIERLLPRGGFYTLLQVGQKVTVFGSARNDTGSWPSGTETDGTTPFAGDKGSMGSFADPTNPGGASASETLTFRANYHKTGSTVTPGTANATGVITLQYN